MWTFRRKSKPVQIGNPEKGLDRSALAYRLVRIREIAEMTEKSVPAAAELADRWVINMATAAYGLPDGRMSEPEVRFIPHPIWDDEWLMTRNGFPTREEAIAYVASVGGELLV